jgi:hemerythrin-like domain-containing protein
MDTDRDRRRLLYAAAAGASLLVGGRAAAKKPPPKPDEDISPTEDLMREHGVLRRILIIYDEAIRRIGAREPLPADALAEAARIVREFIEDYHEKDEEEFLFPRMEKTAHAPLVATLRAQHQAGRRLTDEITRLAAAPPGAPLAAQLTLFNRMYRAHAAREDTVLFPAFREAAGEKELDRLKDVFEAKERALPHGGFEKMVDAVSALETRFAIHDLARFTP